MSDLTAVKFFDIPELTSLVTKHLMKPDLAACAQVSRAWHDTVIPFIYRSVKIVFYHMYVRDRASWSGFQKHSSHMRELDLGFIECHLPLFSSHCTNLTVLRLQPPCDLFGAQWSSGLLKLISKNPSISTLYIDEEIEYYLTVLKLHRYMPALRKLVISGTTMEEQCVNEIMRCAHRLEELVLTTYIAVKNPFFWQPGQRSDLDPLVTELSLKDQDADVDTPDEPSILNPEVHHYRQAVRLKKFRFILSECKIVHPYEPSIGTSRLLRFCCSAKDIYLSLNVETTRSEAMQVLRDQVNQRAWCLKHLDLGPILPTDSQLWVEILGASESSLISLQLRESSLTDELLSVLLQKHSKTLRRVTVKRCQDFFSRAKVEALVSGCPNLQSLDLFKSDHKSADGARLQEASESQWSTSDGRVFKVFKADEAFYAYHADGYYSTEEYAALIEEPMQEDPWLHLDLMWKPDFQSHLRFVAN